MKRLFRPPTPLLTLEPAAGHKLAAALTATCDVEMGCDEIFRLLDECADAAARGEDVSQLMPMPYHHLQMCPECGEEYAALFRAVKLQGPGERS